MMKEITIFAMKYFFALVIGTAIFGTTMTALGCHEKDWTDNQQFSYEIEVSMLYYLHALEMDRANECFRATGSYSAIICDIYFRNKQ